MSGPGMVHNWGGPEQFNLSPGELQLVQERARRRMQMKAEYQRLLYNPYKNMSGDGGQPVRLFVCCALQPGQTIIRLNSLYRSHSETSVYTSDWSIDWLIDWLILFCLMTLIDWFMDCDWLIDCMDFGVDIQSDRLIHWQIDWLIDWLTDRLIQRSSECLHTSVLAANGGAQNVHVV